MLPLLLCLLSARAHGEDDVAPAAPEARETPLAQSPSGPVHVDAQPVAITGDAIRQHALGHVHNKLVHVPLGLGLGLLLVVALGRRAEWVTPAARVLATVGAVGVVASWYTGDRQETAVLLERPDLVSVVDTHAAFGIASVFLFVGAAASWFLKWPLWARAVLALALCLALVGTGLFGGWLATS